MAESKQGGLVVRVRSRCGTWRFNATKAMTIQSLKEKIAQEKRVPVEQQRITLDQGGGSPADSGATIQALGIKHGDMLYLQMDATAVAPVGESISKKIVNGCIVAQTYEDKSLHQGFRPGLMSLRSMKMKWTLADFQELDSSYTYKIKAEKEAVCKAVTLNGEACNIFQRYVHSLAFAARCGYLYGKYLPEGKTQVDVIWEPPQHRDESGEVMEDEDSDQQERADKLAEMLGMEKVGFIFCHPPRPKDAGYRFTAYELLEAAERQIGACGDQSNYDKCGFSIVAVTADEQGNSSFDAFQVSRQCMAMLEAGALLEHEEKDGCVRINETFTAMLEGKPSDDVDTNFFLTLVPIKQHKADILTCTYPIMNRPGAVDPGAALRQHLANNSRHPHAKRVADFQALMALWDMLGEDSIRDVCKSVMHPSIPLQEGYKLMIDSLLQ